MYPMLKMWISAPTPVTTSTMTDDKASTCSAKSILSGPAGIHAQYVRT